MNLDQYRTAAPRKPRFWNVRPHITHKDATGQFIQAFPMAAAAHEKRAAQLSAISDRLLAEKTAMFTEACAEFGGGIGSGFTLISGGFYDHWPNTLKNAMRRFTYDHQVARDAANAHRRAAKRLRRNEHATA